MVNVTKLFASGLMISALVACSSQDTIKDTSSFTQSDKEVTTATADVEQVFADTQATQEVASIVAKRTIINADQPVTKEITTPTPTPTPKPNPLDNIIYFDFDQSTIPVDFREVLNGHVSYLRQNPHVNVLLEGHADERGTREYNMALGERRGNAVSRYLAIQGVSMDAIEVVSFGEERPIMTGRNEGSWAANRRVIIRYKNP
jgi:peptidoglycan-associated lipoprotein